MTITDFGSLSDPSEWIEKIRACDWSAAKFLADLLEKGSFEEMLGKGSLYIMTEKEKLAAFGTLTERDCIDDKSLFPWIGFIYTAPEYRGNRYSGRIIDHACRIAYNQGYKRVYIATDHIGLYEKYGFSYIESRTDIYGTESRIYMRNIETAEALKSFLDSEGRLTAYPAKRKMKLHALIYLAEGFERNKVYTEREVNAVLNERHTFGDPATLRRELYNHCFLNRDSYGKEYRLEDNLPTYEELVKKYE